jgi:iron uptake system component EfeO
MTRPTSARPVTALAAAVLALAAAGCSSDEGSSSDGAAAPGSADTVVSVVSTDDACEVSTTSVPPGSVAFEVTNEGGSPTEFYLYTADDDIVGEVEDVGPGLTRTLTVQDVVEGNYVTACKPGMTGDGIRADFQVTAAAGSSSSSG